MYQHLQLLKRAASLGIKIMDASSLLQGPFSILEYGDISELIKDGVPTSLINLRSQYYCDNKQLTKLVYKTLGIPYPKGLTFQNADEPSLSNFIQKGQHYVCKPLDGTNGIGVITGIQNMSMVKSYYANHKELAMQFMVEEELEGADLRIHVLGRKIIAACIREPAYVTGNGKDSLEVLIENRRKVMQTQNPDNFLVIDAASQKILADQGVEFSTIPKTSQKIFLKYVSNMAQGGIATDVTEEIHPIYQEWVTALCNYLNTGYFGLDLMTTDYTQNPYYHTKVLEINARADWLHHTFSERRSHDIPGMILSEIFGKFIPNK